MQAIGGLFELFVVATAVMGFVYYGCMVLTMGVITLFKALFK